MSKLKVSLFLIIPLVLVGCTAFHYMHQTSSREHLDSQKLNQKNPQAEQRFEKLDGPKR